MHHYSEMPEPLDDLEKLLERVRDADDDATTILWSNYFERLVRIAARRLPANLRRVGDEEDIALSAFHSFVTGIRDDQFPNLQGPDHLWGLLMTLTIRKAHAHLRRHTRQKRGGGTVRGESVFLNYAGESEGPGIADVARAEHAADVQVELAEACDELLSQLPDEQLRQIAIMRMDGYRVDEIAELLTLSKRAVERRLQLIRKTWSEAP